MMQAFMKECVNSTRSEEVANAPCAHARKCVHHVSMSTHDANAAVARHGMFVHSEQIDIE